MKKSIHMAVDGTFNENRGLENHSMVLIKFRELTYDGVQLGMKETCGEESTNGSFHPQISRV